MSATAPPDCDPSTFCGFVWKYSGHNDWLAQSSNWVLVKPLRIIGIILAAMVIRWLIGRMIKRVTTGSMPAILKPLKEKAPAALIESGLLSERRSQRAETIGSLMKSAIGALILVIAAMMILAEFGLNLGPVLATVSIAGVALGFGAQSLVKDILSGVFMLLEDQYGVGDTVDLGEASGTVEAVGLRVTTIRDVRGVVWYVRNGEIVRVGNKSQGWATVVLDIPVGYAGVDEAMDVIRAAVEEFSADEEHATEFLEPPKVLGVEQLTIDGAVVRVTAKTSSEAQWRIGRDLRGQVTAALDAAGISSRIGPNRMPPRPE
ncbi:mechanosensitive ion channel protein MscS [Longispora fulva]|uniref:Small conductance mechanosensitive channel n=1 Tax=Longispora fulva TaxID=619741 RepID=A0A8J7KJT2_9ACTN|nr:mechanosensitive ion channel family protein [Longispora fulva]MBG6140745.1 small conductance mechanosensitive channel [Longispora fulva]GIG60991.1 mechanosensitive ion channel protein MscS [Longispora fulva]